MADRHIRRPGRTTPTHAGIAKSLKVLSSTPAVLRRLVAGMNAGALARRPSRSAWSVAQIVAHLCDGEIVLAYRYRKILSESGCKIQAYDQDRWAKYLRYDRVNVRERLQLFTTLRKSNVALLKSLSAAEWKRFGIHSERGRESVAAIAASYAAHDLTHLGQISKRRNAR